MAVVGLTIKTNIMYSINAMYDGPYTIKTSFNGNSYAREVGSHIVVKAQTTKRIKVPVHISSERSVNKK